MDVVDMIEPNIFKQDEEKLQEKYKMNERFK